MTEKVTRRAALGVLGVGLVSLTGGASRRSRCAVVTGRTGAACADALSLSGPGTVPAGGPNPEFVATNEADTRIDVETGDWAVYRSTSDGWRTVAAGPGGASRTLDASGETGWVLLLDDGRDASGGVGTFSTQTRYVGPVDVEPGEHAFVARGRRDGTRFESVARFAVVG
ncbi:hypothetical protein [Halobacterium jilantaiense]|uniref:Uncharacterized protein n=1 Tax=Halobacterium jilantaiense TaxID=355548 RepID=A0A1I0NUH6_9EURY|nr:hypothetical protein [Halobacterium jilantaiense]SEW05070.1 hypothetical protein SAMN04487945_1144 [Halobacterium jilantaiense]